MKARVPQSAFGMELTFCQKLGVPFGLGGGGGGVTGWAAGSAGSAGESKGVSGSGSATATFPPGSGFIGTTFDLGLLGFLGRAIGLILPLSRAFTCPLVGLLSFGCTHTILLIKELHAFGELQYTSPVQGLSGKQWSSPVSDQEAAMLLRADPNFIQGSLTDSDEATAQEVQLMTACVEHAIADPIIGRAWRDAWDAFRGPAMDDEAQVCWWYAKYTVKFVNHQDLLRDWMFRLDDRQLVISPDALLRMRNPKGNCATFTCLIQTLLRYRGIPYETCAVAVNPMFPEEFTHVYPMAVRPDGSRIALDASHGKYPGWEAPPSRVLKKKCGTQVAMKSQTREVVN